MRYTDETLAKVAHEVNRTLQAEHGDEAPSQPWDSETPELQASTIAGVKRLRAGCTPRQNHQGWYQDKLDAGWTLGPEKDYEKRTHPCMVPWDQLPPWQQEKDRVMAAIVKALDAQAALPGHRRHRPHLPRLAENSPQVGTARPVAPHRHTARAVQPGGRPTLVRSAPSRAHHQARATTACAGV